MGAKAHCFLFYDQNGDDDAISNSFIKKAKKAVAQSCENNKDKS